MKSRRKKSKEIILLSISSLCAALILLPLLWMVLTSFKNGNEVIQFPPSFVPNTLSFDNYVTLFTDTNFLIYLKNSVIVAFSVVTICSICSTIGAYSLTRYQFKGNDLFLFSVLLGYMVAPIMIVIPLFIIMKTLGLANTLISLIAAHTAFCFPFALWMMHAYFKDFPIEYEKAALIDGATWSQILWHVVLPNVFPGLAAVAVFVFILSWNDYVFARILISGDNLKTLPVGVEDLCSSTIIDWGMLMAAGTLISVPILLGFIVIYRFFIKRLAYSGVKN